MNEAFHKIFWGFFLVFLEIHLFLVDILPDPIGYYLIYSGIKLLIGEFPTGKTAMKYATILIWLSIPTVFVQEGVNQQYFSTMVFSGWSIYTTVLSLLKLVLVFYLFHLMIAFAREHCDSSLVERTSKTFNYYMITMLLITILESFSMNTSTTYISVILLVAFITEIVFLVLLRRFRNISI